MLGRTRCPKCCISNYLCQAVSRFDLGRDRLPVPRLASMIQLPWQDAILETKSLEPEKPLGSVDALPSVPKTDAESRCALQGGAVLSL